MYQREFTLLVASVCLYQRVFTLLIASVCVKGVYSFSSISLCHREFTLLGIRLSFSKGIYSFGGISLYQREFSLF